MIALTVALAALLALSMSSNVALFVALRTETREGKQARDLLDKQQDMVAELVIQRDEAMKDAATAKHSLSQQTIRAERAEQQRNNAEERVADLLAENIKGATPDEIRQMARAVFANPLRVVRPSVPEADAPGADRDALIDPFLPSA